MANGAREMAFGRCDAHLDEAKGEGGRTEAQPLQLARPRPDAGRPRLPQRLVRMPTSTHSCSGPGSNVVPVRPRVRPQHGAAPTTSS